MKSMPIGRTIELSSSFPPLVVNQVASDHGKVGVSRAGEYKLVRSGHLNIQFARSNHLKSGQLNYRESVAKGLTRFGLQQRGQEKFVTNVGSESFQNAQVPEVHPQIAKKSLAEIFDIFCRFARFYTLRGSVLGVISSCLLAVQGVSDFTPKFFLGLLQVIIAAALANSFVVSVNQVTDIEIDKINKPYLPLASGELSVKNGIRLAGLFAFLGLSLALYVRSWPLKVALFVWYAGGVIYSVNLPLLRWKATPLLTVICIWVFRGLLVPIMFYLHAQGHMFGRPLMLSKHAIFSSGLFSIFAIVIALFKDLSDVEGDVRNGIVTSALQFGQSRIFWLSVWLLQMAFGMAILAGLSSTQFWIRPAMATSQIILGYIWWKYTSKADIKNTEEMHSLYMLIWKLLYVEYFLLPVLKF